MIHIRREGEPLKKGLNVYAWRDRKSSIGFVWCWNTYAKWFRYSPQSRKFFFTSHRAQPDVYAKCFDK